MAIKIKAAFSLMASLLSCQSARFFYTAWIDLLYVVISLTIIELQTIIS
jgi:hypothetical protein